MAEAPNADDKVAKTGTEDDIKFVVEGEAPPPKADKKLTDDDDDEGDDDDYHLTPKGEEDADRQERIREARRVERRERRERRALAMERDKHEIRAMERLNRELLDRVMQLEGRTQQSDARQIDDRLSHTLQQHQEAERVLADAIAKGDGQLAAKALRVRDAAAEENRKLQSVKARISEAPAPQRQQAPDPRVTALASEWAEDNAWYDPSGQDPDSQIVLAIDRAIAAEGMDPRDEDYWDELEARVARALPHKKKGAPPRRREPPTSDGRGSSTSKGGAKTFMVSASRKKAMEEAGIWDDPVKRAKQIRAYAEYDKNSRG